MKTTFFALSIAIAALTTSVSANEYADQLNELANGRIHEIAQSSEVVAAIAAQNAMTSSYDQAKIDALDQQWRAEVDASAKPMIDGVLASDVSGYLSSVLEESEGMFTEIFATDALGLNVGQSGVTSDYWQGDEDKWQTPFNTGETDISDVEEDESTQTFQSQVSVPVVDDAGNAIGAITFGVNVEFL